MAGPERIEWRRAFPTRALAMLAWYVGVGGAALGLVWLLFGGEPAQLDDGSPNPLAVILPLALAVALLAAVPLVLAVVRRPVVAANHYALTVRPGAARTLVLPWARIARVTVRRLDHEAYLLIRCANARDALGDHPSWIDQGVLRSLLRGSRAGRAVAAEYDLAVRMRDFVGEPHALLATVAAFAPDHVFIGSDVEV